MNIIEQDEEDEIYTPSTCKCYLCVGKKKVNIEWSKFKPVTNSKVKKKPK